MKKHRKATVDAVLDVLSVDGGKEFETIQEETGLGKTVLWELLGKLKGSGTVVIVGHRKTMPNGKRAIYALSADPRPPIDDSPMKRVIARVSGGLASLSGPFAVLVAQVTAAD